MEISSNGKETFTILTADERLKMRAATFGRMQASPTDDRTSSPTVTMAPLRLHWRTNYDTKECDCMEWTNWGMICSHGVRQAIALNKHVARGVYLEHAIGVQ